MARVVDVGTLIDREPAIRGGRPKIAGTGVTVRRISVWYKKGFSPEEIAANWGYVTVAQVHAALAYYHANTEEIESDLAKEESLAEELERAAAENNSR